jgi:cyclic beta-1,2-glucan synthetase
MKPRFRIPFLTRTAATPWHNKTPIREELFGVERLEQHAISLAEAQTISSHPPMVQPLRSRLTENTAVLLAAYRAGAAELEQGRELAHAAEWLLDNYHLVEAQIREIRDDLPAGYYRQLPKLASGPFAGYPRVFGIAWAFVAHTDSHFDPEMLRHFILAYQRVQPLTIGELWAVAITLRIVLIENLRRLAEQITEARQVRADANALGLRLLETGCGLSALDDDIASRETGPLSELFAAQLAKGLRDQDPRTTPALGWLEQRLAQQGVTIDEVVQHSQLRQGASNVSVRNVITSMRLISDIDWTELFESMSLVDQRLGADGAYTAMDFPTRNLYRSAIETLARHSDHTEQKVTEEAIRAAQSAATNRAATTEHGADVHGAMSDPGYYLIGAGRPDLERTLKFRPPLGLRLSRLLQGLGIWGYAGAICSISLLLTGLSVWLLSATGVNSGWLGLFAVSSLLPASAVASAIVDQVMGRSVQAMPLPGMDLTHGVPTSLRTLIVVPTLLTSESDLQQQVEQLEIHHLSGISGDLTFALLTDGLDADAEIVPGDEALLSTAIAAIRELNLQYGPGPAGDRFLLLHRHRRFNAGENKWMGWERKRGKLQELNNLLRGATDTSFMSLDGQAPSLPANVRYVITLDADTQLPRDCASRLIGKMAHPLNRPYFDATSQRVIRGYGVLQPRVTPSLPQGQDGSYYQRLYSGPGGMDPYATATSDIYQDLFAEGSFTGKGIYDVDAFDAALRGRVPENSLLSHDLFEGTFARAGLVSDIEVVEEFPSRYDVCAKRQHRWTRGDWQLLGWIFGTRTSQPLPTLGRWKMLDNLRRSLLAPCGLLALVAAWQFPLHPALIANLLIFSTLAIPALLPQLFGLLPHKTDLQWHHHIAKVGNDLQRAIMQSLLSWVFLADQGWRMGDAIVRTLYRLTISRHHLLEWTTAAQSAQHPRLAFLGFYQHMAAGTLLAALLGGGTLVATPQAWPLVLPVTLIWLLAPLLAYWTSRPRLVARELTCTPQQASALRLVARQTWRYFETFVTATENHLPPDNFQDEPRPVVAHRTSPTNMGLYLLSTLAARDFGWAGLDATVSRLEITLQVMQSLPRFKGHFYNWYATQTLLTLEPGYISSVDSGNLAGHLIVVATTCESWEIAAAHPQIRSGLQDTYLLAHEALEATEARQSEPGQELAAYLNEIKNHLFGLSPIEHLLLVLLRLTEKTSSLAHHLSDATSAHPEPDLVFWLDALKQAVIEHAHDQQSSQEYQHQLALRLQAVADQARTLALAMDFAFLMDPDRQLLSIGYSLTDNRLDTSCYDLLASEARLASLFAIAKGDVITRHWFRLGRGATPLGTGSALISWSGSMFEYLMPSLIMRAPIGSLLEQTNRLIVARQIRYGHLLGIPWGISESGYNVRDMEFTYQYSNFGVPGLGLKRGLSENRVIAPYATGLAAMVNPGAAVKNYQRLASLGARGRYGFYEAIDFTASHLPEDQDFAVVHNYMAHHQGMSIVAIANALYQGKMRSRFHSEPMIQSCELLLQERMPRDVAIIRPRAEEVKASQQHADLDINSVRRLVSPTRGTPITHLLSNGRYAIMLTGSGAGYSRWRNIAITRWQEDATRDHWGTFLFLRDTQSGEIWSPSIQPLNTHTEGNEVLFAEDHAEFIHRDGRLTTTLEILVSGETDGEVRRISLTNRSRRTREVELTSYAEIVLAAPDTDRAHPAFAKLFVVTEYLPEFGALIATRRTRTPDETPIWAAHFTIVEGDIVAPLQYESDRARFIGRGRTVASAHALLNGVALSNTVGTVLDPIFSLRQRVTVSPGGITRVAFWTLVAPSRDALLELIDQHHNRNAFERAKTLAWTQAQVQLHHLNIKAGEAADFQRLAAPLLYADPRFRVPSEAIVRGLALQSGLWPHAISGDLPILLLRIDDVEDLAQVRQLLLAHEYLRMKRLAVDLVIINEHASSYVQDLQTSIETAVRSSQSRPHFDTELAQGTVYTLRADLMNHVTRELLQAAARVVLVARRGSIQSQLDHLPILPLLPIAPTPVLARQHNHSKHPHQQPDLEFFNGLGGFAKNGTEYVTLLNAGNTTPAPWVNVIANPNFGFQVSADGSGYTWAENSRENQLTPWSNDPIIDPVGEAIYLRDDESMEIWSATALPIRSTGTYRACHGHGYSRFEHQAGGIQIELLQYVPVSDTIKISRLTLTNQSDKIRHLSVTTYVEWVLGASRSATAPFLTSQSDPHSGALLVQNPWNLAFPGRVAFSDLGPRQTSYTAHRGEFLGVRGSPAQPAALTRRAPLSGKIGAGFDPCAAQQMTFELAPGQSIEVVQLLGQSPSVDEASAMIRHYRARDLDRVLRDVVNQWETLLGAIQVKTPDRAMDIMLNGWLLYQTLACRIWARSAFYQASGAYGFRDQLQDGMALTFAQPAATRLHLLRTAARQFVEGDVQHWWLPHSGQGVRTRISDDRVWLAYATATYVTRTADEAILDEQVPFLDGPRLTEHEHDAFFQPMTADESASLFEHCARGLDLSIALTGSHGLPLIGSGDWNDGMNRVGQEGKGESVWLGWLLIRTIALFAPLASARHDARAEGWLAHASKVRSALERYAWDGAWYRRATFDDGTWLGSQDNLECQIDSIAQSWAVISGAANPVHAAQAMASLEKHLIQCDEGLALLFTPPFDSLTLDPGYIRGYPPGLRENGGQYTHAAIWAIMAFTHLGAGEKAHELFKLLNPINHALTAKAVERYKVEPYVIAADVYSVPPHAGRGGWTWYTGAAGWMYQAGIEGILGIRRQGHHLVIAPCLPKEWPGFTAEITVCDTRYSLKVIMGSPPSAQVSAALFDGEAMQLSESQVRVPLDGGVHRLTITY